MKTTLENAKERSHQDTVNVLQDLLKKTMMPKRAINKPCKMPKIQL